VRLFENQLGADGNTLQLRLEGGPGSNRAAIGARVEVKAGGFAQTREVDGGHGQAGAQRDFTQFFGLGAACEAVVTVRWPNLEGTTETYRLAANYRYKWVQGQGVTVW
jgi:ribosomal protein L15E